MLSSIVFLLLKFMRTRLCSISHGILLMLIHLICHKCFEFIFPCEHIHSYWETSLSTQTFLSQSIGGSKDILLCLWLAFCYDLSFSPIIKVNSAHINTNFHQYFSLLVHFAIIRHELNTIMLRPTDLNIFSANMTGS